MRPRHAIFLLAMISGAAESVVACSSSDKPPPGAGGSGGIGSSGGGTALADSAVDQQSADAADAQPLFSDDGACLNDVPAPNIDGGFQGGDDAGVPICPTTGTCVTYCNDIVAHFRLGVAQVAVTCLRKLPDCSAVLDVQLCVENALMEACQDPTAAAACTPLVLPCDPNAGRPGSLIDENGCEGFMKGLSPTGRGVFASCIQSKIDAGTCPSDVRLCTDQIQL